MNDPAFYQRDSAAITGHKAVVAEAQAELDAAYARWEAVEDSEEGPRGAMPEAGKAIAPVGRPCGSSPRGFRPQATLARGMRLRYTGVPPGERHVQNPAALRPARLFAEIGRAHV